MPALFQGRNRGGMIFFRGGGGGGQGGGAGWAFSHKHIFKETLVSHNALVIKFHK